MMAKKKKLTFEEKLETALIPLKEQPYKLPNNWVWTKLENIGKWGSGGTPSRKNLNYYTNGVIPWIKTGELNNEEIFDAKEYITEEALKKSSAKLFPKGSIALAMYGATIGKVGFFKNELATNQACAVVFPKKEVKNKYIFYYLISQKQNFIKLGKGGAQPNISQKVIKDYIFPLPPFKEQERIVNKIEYMLERIKTAKKLILEAKETFEFRRARILYQAFTGELTAKWREENLVDKAHFDRLLKRVNEEKIIKWEEKCKKAIEEGKKIPKKEDIKLVHEMKVSLEEQPYRLPDGWGWIKLGDIFEEVKEKVIPTDDFIYKYIGLEHLKKGGGIVSVSTSKELKSSKTKFKSGDVLYGKLRPYLNKHSVVDFDGVCSTDIICYRNSDENRAKLLDYYLGLASTINYSIKNSSGINLPRVSPKAMLNLPFPLITSSEEKEIIRQLELLLTAEEEVKDLLNMEKQINLLEKSILSKAFRGELGSNDLKDKPAMELLKKMLLEKKELKVTQTLVFPPQKKIVKTAFSLYEVIKEKKQIELMDLASLYSDSIMEMQDELRRLLNNKKIKIIKKDGKKFIEVFNENN